MNCSSRVYLVYCSMLVLQGKQGIFLRFVEDLVGTHCTYFDNEHFGKDHAQESNQMFSKVIDSCMAPMQCLLCVLSRNEYISLALSEQFNLDICIYINQHL